jgi:undecaprenyl diphosphate synthase
MTESSAASDSSASFESVPHHIAIIMDGNSRWARDRGVSRASGHKAGAEAIRVVLSACIARGVEALTLFAFSSENWQRSPTEVSALMQLFSVYLGSEVKKLHKDNIRLRFIGDRSRLKPALVKRMAEAELQTQHNSRFTLVIAVDYGGQWDIAQAARYLSEQVQLGKLEPAAITPELIDQHIALHDLPKPDLCIRTAGEQRISNFLLWQLAYAELYFADIFWPDFNEAALDKALYAFANRERRYGARLDDDSPSDQEVVDA